MPEPPPPPVIPFPDNLPVLTGSISNAGLFIVTFDVNGVTNTVGQITGYNIRIMFYGDSALRWNGNSFESCNAGRNWAAQVMSISGNGRYNILGHGSLEEIPATDDFSYRMVADTE